MKAHHLPPTCTNYKLTYLSLSYKTTWNYLVQQYQDDDSEDGRAGSCFPEIGEAFG